MPEANKQGSDITKEQLSDVYAAGTSDGIMKTEDGLIRIDEQGRVKEVKAESDDGNR
jgi:hypothetical protein